MLAGFPHLFEPHSGLLLEQLGRLIDESMLREIAEADYGADAEAHHAALRRMRDTGFVPQSNEWEPREVLELIRWSRPDQPEWKPGGYGERGHWMRAFCCASLLRMAGEDDMGAHHSFNETVAGLVASLDALDAGLWAEAGAFFGWFMDQLAGAGDQGEAPFVGMAVLHCALRIESIPDPAIIALCQWIIEREEAEAQEPYAPGDGHGWLHRISFHDQHRDIWTKLGEALAEPGLARSEEVLEWVGVISLSLAESDDLSGAMGE
ncbi:hypothetical protein [Sphingomonas alpina]|uniref:Uncharacterized protein n=1 Tax=Sphingomonas alpina TaxID=653931 RepID=A0A7H0LF99_9SPHN|nr:hypothetical protein [Sphingomonas alpina]QNQ08352.1 hypothetical protein H3Z74_16570 [Sphingomonas alpina]